MLERVAADRADQSVQSFRSPQSGDDSQRFNYSLSATR